MANQKQLKVKLKDIKSNPDNPRVIKDDKFHKLVKSIKEFPQMLELRPLVIDETNTVLGGNMRLRALQEAGYTEVTAIKVESLTEEQKREFIIKDNLGYGEWDWDMLANEWNSDELKDWGMDIPNWIGSDEINQVEEDVENVGLPDFELKGTEYKLIINFIDEETRQKFVDENEIQLQTQGKSAWSTIYPFEKRQDIKSLKYE